MTPDLDDVLPGLIEKLYAAVGTTDRWYPFLQALCADLHSTSANLMLDDLRRAQGNVAVAAGTHPEAVRQSLGRWIAAEPWTRSTSARGPGEVAVVSDTARNRDAALLAALMPHLQRAIHLHRRLAAATGLASQTTAALDLFAHAVILLDDEGRPTRTNGAADLLLERRDGLEVHCDKLRAADPQTTAALGAAIATAAELSHVGRPGRGELLTLRRPSGRLSLSALVSPFEAPAVPLGPQPSAVIVVVTDPECVPLPSGLQLQAAFGFTPAEARFALALLAGESLDEVGTRLSITRNTARTHLRQLFAKTGTNRQAELVRLLIVSTAPLLPDSDAGAPT